MKRIFAGLFRRRSLWPLVVLTAAGAAAAWAAVREAEQPSSLPDGDELVEMTITVNEDRPDLYVDVAVPAAYLGPRFLEISKKNRQGGLQKSFLMQFRYPSMQPRFSDDPGLEDRTAPSYAAVTTTVPGSVRKTATGDIESHTESKPKSVCGIKKYIEIIYKSKYLIYYHKSENIHDDVFVKCYIKYNTDSEPHKCRYYLETDKQLAITLNSIPGEMICEWKEIADKVRGLADSFVVEEVKE